MTSAAENTLMATTGVDIRPLVYRGKFVFVAQVGSPQIAGSILEVSVTSGSSCSATNLSIGIPRTAEYTHGIASLQAIASHSKTRRTRNLGSFRIKYSQNTELRRMRSHSKMRRS